MEPRLHNAQEILRSQLHDAHNDVDVGIMAADKNKFCNTNHFNISYFRNPISFSLVDFHTYIIDYLDSCFDHLITLFVI